MRIAANFTFFSFKGTVSQDFASGFFMDHLPLKTALGSFKNFFKNWRRYSKVKVHRQQRHWRQTLPPVWLMLLKPVANNGINIRLLTP
jgi:hypothetical protein